MLRCCAKTGQSVSVVHNEQTKLTATALNNVAVATVIAGFLGPIIALRSEGTPRMDEVAIVASVAWLLIGWIPTLGRPPGSAGAEGMTLLELYVFFGLPLIALGMGFGALWLTRPPRKNEKNSR